ncbi:MAG TPA: CHAD domain-containing protein [Armatimonadota bacterium]|jgi:CHAD domain-containing protein
MATDIDPNAPFRQEGARYMREQNRRMHQHLAGTLAGEDPEELHDMRVASRRLRAAMVVFESCFPKGAYLRWRRRVSSITGALGGVRDMDVQIAAIERRREGLPESQQADVDAWLQGLKSRRDGARNAMIAALKRWERRRRGDALDLLLVRIGREDPLCCLLERLEGARHG